MENNENKQKKKRLLALLLLLLALLIGSGLLWKCNRSEGEGSLPTPSPVEEELEREEQTTNTPRPLPNTRQTAYAQRKRERKVVVEQEVQEEPSVQVVEEFPVKKEIEKTVVKEERKAVEEEEPDIDQEEDIAVDTAKAFRPSFKKSHFRFGPRLGIGYTSITRLGGILESYSVRPNFDMIEKGHLVPRIGLFGEWRYKRIGVELGADYTMFNTSLKKTTPLTGLVESYKFRYDILYTQLLGNVYLTPYMYMGAGVSVAFPFVSRNIVYTTNRNNFYQQVDALTRQHLRSSLDRKVQFMPTIKAGYQFVNGLELSLEYSYGISDFIKTLANDYGYNERHNNTHFVSFTVGYDIFKY